MKSGTDRRNVNHLRYTISVGYSEEDECYVARSASWPLIAADGETPKEALESMIDALNGAIEVSREYGKRIPESDPILEALSQYREILNISKVAKLSHLNRNTLASKLRRGTRFSEEESLKIRGALEEIGIPIGS